MPTTDELFHERGPEANNLRAAAFESQLEAMASTLGWTVVCSNVDARIGDKTPSRGIDLLCAFQNPQTGEKDGILCEAKVHGGQARLSVLQDELQTLHDKMTHFNHLQAFVKNPYIRDHVDSIVWGLLAHQTEAWDPEAARKNLRSVALRSLHKAPHVTTLIFAGPDTLEAVADCFALRGSDRELVPAKFLWPTSEDAGQAWATCCPPHQLAAGMLAYRTNDDRTVLWIRDTLDDKDLRLIEDIAHNWQIDPDVVVFSELSPDAWRLRRQAWDHSAERTAGRPTGVLPTSAFVQARNLTYAAMNRFADLWPAQEDR